MKIGTFVRGGPTKWELHPVKQGLGQHKADWDGLNAALCGSNPYFDGDFIDNLLKHFADGNEQLCVHRHGGKIDGMLIVRPQAWGRWALFLPPQAQIGALLVKDARMLADLPEALPGIVWSLDYLCQDPLYDRFKCLQGELPLLSVNHVRTMGIGVDGCFEDYWQARPRKLRHNMARYFKRLRATGLPLRLVHLDSVADMPSAVERYGALESDGWKGRQGTAIHVDNAQGRFYRDLMTDFARRGKASVYELYLGDALAAMRLCIVSGGMMLMLKTAYDERYAKYAPGRLLLHALLAREFEQHRFSAIEFYTNANKDQIAWATDTRMIQHVQAFSGNAVKAAYLLVRRAKGVFAKTRESASGNPPAFVAMFEDDEPNAPTS